MILLSLQGCLFFPLFLSASFLSAKRNMDPGKKRPRQSQERGGNNGKHPQFSWSCPRCRREFHGPAFLSDCTNCQSQENDPESSPRLNSSSSSEETLPIAPPKSFTLLSMNVAELQPSSVAPLGWDPVPDFRKELLRHNADVICLQELPSSSPTAFPLPEYSCVGTASSHCGYVGLYLRSSWLPYASLLYLPPSEPAILVQLRWNDDSSLVLGSCHLAPFGENAALRLKQMKSIVGRVESDSTTMSTGVDKNFILAGDFNMRQKEDSTIEKQASFRDAWKECGATRNHKNTWDTTDHSPKGKPNTGPHNRYHADGYPFACRFDRVYFRGKNIQAKSFSLFANAPITSPFHFLSDHFGMKTTFTLISK